MSLLHQPQPDLLLARSTLAAARLTLADRELQLAALRTELKSFEGRYLRQVGTLYAHLDDLEARIADAEVRLYDSDAARLRAAQAHRRAHDTHEAAFGPSHDAPTDPPPDLEAALKKLFRELARRVHPDFARTPADAAHCTRLMARANTAYARADLDALQRLLDDSLEAQPTPDEDLAAELLRLTRQIAHAQRDIAAADLELSTLPTNEIAQLKLDADAAALHGRDLLTELATTLQTRITESKYRLTFLDRQLFAHGK
jgi:hypothetical protein